MNYQELTEIVANLPVKASSKAAILKFFFGYNDFLNPKITTMNNYAQLEWEFVDTSNIRMIFDGNTVEYSYVNKFGISEKGTYKIDQLRQLLTIKNLPILPQI